MPFSFSESQAQLNTYISTAAEL